MVKSHPNGSPCGARSTTKRRLPPLTATSGEMIVRGRKAQYRRNLFNAGASALKMLGWLDHTAYVCPLFGEVVTEDQWLANPDLLSDEHVPPEALGGRVLCLTCKKCNSRSGHTIDSEATKRLRLHRFARSKSDATRPERATLEWTDGLHIRVEIVNHGNNILIFGIPKANDSQALARWEADLA